MRGNCKRFLPVIISVIIIVLFSISVNAADEEFLDKIPDENLRRSLKNITTDGILTYEELEKIKKVDLSNDNISDLTGIDYCKNLVEINISANKITNLEVLKNLKSIKTIAANNLELTDVTIFSQIPTLSTLSLENNQISIISGLSGSTVSSLNLKGNLITDITPLNTIQNLKTVNLSNNKIESLPLLALPALANLDLSSNNLGNNIGGLNSIITIDTLNLDSNGISDITFLKDIKDIKTLNLSNNKIRDISALQNISINNLYLNNNQIIDITPIKSKTDLQNFEINNNLLDLSTDSTTLDILKEMENANGNKTAEFAYQTQKVIKLVFNPGEKGYCDPLNIELYYNQNYSIPYATLFNHEFIGWDINGDNAIDYKEGDNFTANNIDNFTENISFTALYNVRSAETAASGVSKIKSMANNIVKEYGWVINVVLLSGIALALAIIYRKKIFRK